MNLTDKTLKMKYEDQGFIYFDNVLLNEILEIKNLIEKEVEVKYEINNLNIRSIYGFQNNEYFVLITVSKIEFLV